jgi:hypothetical protein
MVSTEELLFVVMRQVTFEGDKKAAAIGKITGRSQWTVWPSVPCGVSNPVLIWREWNGTSKFYLAVMLTVPSLRHICAPVF